MSSRRTRKAASRSRRRRDDFRPSPQRQSLPSEIAGERDTWCRLPDPYSLADIGERRRAAEREIASRERELSLLRRALAALAQMEEGFGELAQARRDIADLEQAGPEVAGAPASM